MKFGEILKPIIEETNLSIYKISQKSGVDRSLIHGIITKQTDPVFDTVIYILGGVGYKLYLTAPDNRIFAVDDFTSCMRIIMFYTNSTVAELAEQVGRSKSQIRKYWNGDQSPRFSVGIDVIGKSGFVLNAVNPSTLHTVCLHQE